MSMGSTAMAKAISRHRFSVEDYHRMVEVGVLTENDRVELLRGEIVVMAPIGSRHACCVDQLLDCFTPIRSRARLRVQNPVSLPSASVPEPDFVLARSRPHRYADRHPGPADLLLVVEVAETSQVLDREVKAPLYAENGIREYWLVDLATDQVEVYRRPEGEGYAEMRTAGRGEALAPEAFPDLEVRVDDLLA